MPESTEPVTQLPLASLKQPAESVIPFPNVDVADVEVILSAVAWRPAAKVDVALVDCTSRLPVKTPFPATESSS